MTFFISSRFISSSALHCLFQNPFQNPFQMKLHFSNASYHLIQVLQKMQKLLGLGLDSSQTVVKNLLGFHITQVFVLSKKVGFNFFINNNFKIFLVFMSVYLKINNELLLPDVNNFVIAP